MIDVLSYVRLKQHGFRFSSDSAAIDGVLRDMSDFRHVRMRRNEITVRQNKARESAGIFLENGTEIREFHGSIYIRIWEYSQTDI